MFSSLYAWACPLIRTFSLYSRGLSQMGFIPIRLSDCPVSLLFCIWRATPPAPTDGFEIRQKVSHFVGELSVCHSNETVGSWSSQFTLKNCEGFSKEMFFEMYWKGWHQIRQIGVKKLKMIVSTPLNFQPSMVNNLGNVKIYRCECLLVRGIVE